jgi:glycosyltransferase involved in cell wall biosynthesis
MRLRFITSTPLDVSRGSGTYVGITALIKALENLGVEINLLTPKFRLPIYTAQRLLFNQTLRFRRLPPCDATIGFDMDGYTLAHPYAPHIASIKGVIADEMRFESGLTHATMRLQAACERIHVHRAHALITTSQYSARQIQTLYQTSRIPHIVPELIDLATWNELSQIAPSLLRNGMPHVSPPLRNVGTMSANPFTVLSVARFYPRKRIDVLLRAAARLRDKIPGLEVRIVGGGPELPRLQKIWREEHLQPVVTWRENISQSELVREYKHCDVFCLPSVQEGFGIVFLEAMASGKPIVAARAAAVPEVVQHGLLVDPDRDESFAAALERLYREKALRESLAAAALDFVRHFDAPIVAQSFLRTIELATKPQTKLIS